MLRVMPAVMAAGGEQSALVELDSTTLGSAASEITFSGISADYADLMVTVFGRGTRVSGTTELRLRVNGDTAGNYDRQLLQGSATTAVASELLAGTSILVGELAAANAPANVPGGATIQIFDYARTAWQKGLVSLSGSKESTSSGGVDVEMEAGFWRSTSAITSITFLPDAANFDTNTIATLYGWR